jgi:hypothetical protein
VRPLAFDPTRRIHKMRDVRRMVLAMGGEIRMTGATEITISHPLMPQSVTTNATRTESSDKVTTWCRQLFERRELLRAAFGFQESA